MSVHFLMIMFTFCGSCNRRLTMNVCSFFFRLIVFVWIWQLYYGFFMGLEHTFFFILIILQKLLHVPYSSCKPGFGPVLPWTISKRKTLYGRPTSHAPFPGEWQCPGRCEVCGLRAPTRPVRRPREQWEDVQPELPVPPEDPTLHPTPNQGPGGASV